MNYLLKTVSTAALVIASAAPATATDTINIAVVSGYAPTASWVKIFEEYFVPEVDKKLAETGNYEINWNLGFSGTVAKPRGELDAVTDGIADLGITVPVFHADKLPMHNITFSTPFVTSDLHLLLDALKMLAETEPAFLQEWEDLGLVYLGSAGSVDNYQAVCKTDKPTPESFQGVKVSGAGANLLYFQGVGAVGVSSNLGDYYNEIQTGLTECASVWAESAAGYKLYEVAPFYIKVDQGAAISFAVAANESFWEGLPGEVKDVLQEATDGYGNALADYVDSAAAAALETITANGGTITQYTQEQRQTWAAGMPNIAQDWAAALDAQGKRGTETLKLYMDFMREHDQPIAREWDKP